MPASKGNLSPCPSPWQRPPALAAPGGVVHPGNESASGLIRANWRKRDDGTAHQVVSDSYRG